MDQKPLRGSGFEASSQSSVFVQCFGQKFYCVHWLVDLMMAEGQWCNAESSGSCLATACTRSQTEIGVDKSWVCSWENPPLIAVGLKRGENWDRNEITAAAHSCPSRQLYLIQPTLNSYWFHFSTVSTQSMATTWSVRFCLADLRHRDWTCMRF